MSTKNQIWNAITLICATAALFFLFTNGIPLHEWGWAKEIGKSRGVALMRISVSAFALLLLCLRLQARRVIRNLFIVRLAEKQIQSPDRTLFFLYFLYALALCAGNVYRHLVFGTRAFDLGIFAQALWTTLHGDFLYSSLKGGICLLGDHISPLLALLAPIYALWQDPRTLLILQPLVSATCMFLIAALAKEKLKDSAVVLAMVLVYFFYLPTRNALHEDFHPETLVEPLILAAFLLLERKKITPFLLCLPFIAAAKENMLGVTCALGFYAFCFRRRYFLGSTIMVLSLAIFYFETRWLVPHLTGQPYFYQAVYTQLHSPDGLFKVLLSKDSFAYFFKFYGLFLFLPLFHPPTFLLTLPIFFQNILASNPLARSFGYHYTVGLTPFAFVATLCGWQKLNSRFQWMENRKRGFACLFLFIALIQSGPSEYYAYWQSRKVMNEHGAHLNLLSRKLSEIPESASVLTHNSVAPHLANRKSLFLFSDNREPSKADQVKTLQPDLIVMENLFWEPDTLPFAETVQSLERLDYQEYFRQDSLVILKKSH